ncbi:MAG: SDR family oxidoreductase [Dietzia sp.]
MSTPGHVERFSLAGRTALVTGARSGIGRSVALGLADAGADIVAWGRTDAGMEEVVDEVRARGREAEVVTADLADLEAVRAAASALLERRGIDILVNNAGMILREDAAATSLADWRKVLDVNLDATFALSQLVAGPMLERGSGSIVSIASLLSFQGGVRVPAYTASKHAVVGLTKALANEWAGSGVNVNAVAPGYIATDNTAALREDPEREQSIRARIPAGRWGQPDDLVGAVVFLCTPAAAYVHGHTLVVDGGWMGR